MPATQTISQIYNNIIATKNQQIALNNLNNPSQSAVWNLWSFITATAIWASQQVWNIFYTATEQEIALAPAWTPQWIQYEAFQFQYSSTIPQVISLNSAFTPSYTVVNSSLQIISQCSVITQPDSIVQIKVATGTPPSALNTAQSLSFLGYMQEILPAGISPSVISLQADQVYVNANVWYNGQYSSVIQQNVTNSIVNYFSNIEFDGYVRTSSLETAILNCQGVTDVELLNVAARANSVPFSGATYLVQNSTEILNKQSLYAGYCIPETTGGYTIPGSINFIIGS